MSLEKLDKIIDRMKVEYFLEEAAKYPEDFKKLLDMILECDQGEPFKTEDKDNVIKLTQNCIRTLADFWRNDIDTMKAGDTRTWLKVEADSEVLARAKNKAYNRNKKEGLRFSVYDTDDALMIMRTK